MPSYEFKCKKCKKNYSELSPYDETGKYKNVICPFCNSKSKLRLLSAPAFKFSNPIGTDIWNNSHDYRFKTKLPEAIKEREMAEKLSHIGAHKHIDDISSGKNFGEVK
jgi:putative FmdB family regulatory protein